MSRPRMASNSHKSGSLSRNSNAFAIQKPTKTQRMVGKSRPNFTNLKQVVNQVERLSSVLQPERKYNEDASDTANYYSSGAAPIVYSTCFGGIATSLLQGDDEEERIGSKISLVDITWKLQVRMDDTAGEDNLFYRCILLLVKQQNATNASLNGLLHEYLSNPDISPAISTITGINRNYSSNYVILRDKTYTLNDVGTGNTRYHKWYHKLDNITAEYYDDGMTDQTSNTLWYIVIPSTQVTTAFFLSSYVRMNFTDL